MGDDSSGAITSGWNALYKNENGWPELSKARTRKMAIDTVRDFEHEIGMGYISPDGLDVNARKFVFNSSAVNFAMVSTASCNGFGGIVMGSFLDNAVLICRENEPALTVPDPVDR